jgi:cell division protein FtsL
MKSLVEFIRADFGIVMLTFAVLVSSLAIVYIKHMSRSQFVELQKLEQHRDKLNEEWGRLLLEQSTWATPGRVEYEARKRLKMIVPTPEMTVVIKP